MYVCMYVFMYVYVCTVYYSTFYITYQESQLVQGQDHGIVYQRAQVQVPCVSKELYAGIVFLGGGVILQRQKGNFPQHFGICEISHKSYISREFSHQYMEKFQRKFNLYARMKSLLNKHTWESHSSFATVHSQFPDFCP